MSYKSTLQEHNTLLQQAIDKANALPDAGGGGNVDDTILTAFVSNWYVSVGNQNVPDSFVVFFRPGWTWADYMSSVFNKCPESLDGELTQNKGPVQAVIINRYGTVGCAISKSHFPYIIKDWDAFEETDPTDLIEEGKIYYIG